MIHELSNQNESCESSSEEIAFKHILEEEEIVQEQEIIEEDQGIITHPKKKYNSTTLDIRLRCLQEVKSKNIRDVSEYYGVKIKTLKRWIKHGAERKKGGGRKVQDQDMVNKLLAWYRECQAEGKRVTSTMIKEKALTFSTIPGFAASKGWLEKFKKKYHIQFNRKKHEAVSA